MYQRLGFQCFTETLFEDAGKHFFEGDLDPSLLISYYPELRGSLFNANDSINVFSGVLEHIPRESSVDDISRYPFHHFAFLTDALLNPPFAALDLVSH